MAPEQASFQASDSTTNFYVSPFTTRVHNWMKNSLNEKEGYRDLEKSGKQDWTLWTDSVLIDMCCWMVPT